MVAARILHVCVFSSLILVPGILFLCTHDKLSSHPYNRGTMCCFSRPFMARNRLSMTLLSLSLCLGSHEYEVRPPHNSYRAHASSEGLEVWRASIDVEIDARRNPTFLVHGMLLLKQY